MTTLYTADGPLTVPTRNIIFNGDSVTIDTGEGVPYDIQAADLVGTTVQFTESLRDSRAANVSVVESVSLSDSVGSVGEIVDEVTISIAGTGAQFSAVDTFAEISDKVEYAVQNSYDAGFSDGYTAGYDDGFAAAKGVVKN